MIVMGGYIVRNPASRLNNDEDIVVVLRDVTKRVGPIHNGTSWK